MKKSAVQNTFNVKKSEQRTSKLFVSTEFRVYVADIYEHYVPIGTMRSAYCYSQNLQIRLRFRQ